MDTRITTITTERRAKVLKLLMKGNTTPTIVKKITEEYDVGEKSVENDITIAYKDIRKKYDLNKEKLIVKHMALYDQIIEDTDVAMDYANKIKAMNQKEKLLKLHLPDTMIQVNNNTLNNIDLKDLSVDDLKNMLNGEEADRPSEEDTEEGDTERDI